MFSEESDRVGIQLGYVPAIAIDLVFGLFSTLGYIIQRYTHIQNAKKTITQQNRSVQRPLWWLGIIIYVVFGVATSIIVLSNLPFFVAVPLGAVKLIYNVVYSRIILKERIHLDAALGTLYIAIGAVTIGFCGALDEPSRNITDMLRVYRRPTFIIYEIILFIVLLSLVFVTQKFRRIGARRKGILYGVAATICSSQAGLFAKAGLSLLNRTIFGGVNEFVHIVAFIIVTVMLILPVIGLVLFNKSLKLCETVVSIPITFCIAIILSVVNTFVYYEDLTFITWWKWIIIMLAAVYLVFGVHLLSNTNTTSITHVAVQPPLNSIEDEV